MFVIAYQLNISNELTQGVIVRELLSTDNDIYIYIYMIVVRELGVLSNVRCRGYP